jgi:sporulation protein YlmC with PRC-barrel domain
MRTVCMIIMAGAAVAALAEPALAQTSAVPATIKAAAPKGVTDPSKDNKGHSSENQGTPAVVVDDNQVENLLGRDVKSASGEKLGQITDVIVDKTGDVRAAVIDFGGFLGVGSRKVAVAWSALKFSPGSIVVDMTRDELRVTPEYRAGEPIVVVGSQHPQTSGSPPSAAKPPATK